MGDSWVLMRFDTFTILQIANFLECWLVSNYTKMTHCMPIHPIQVKIVTKCNKKGNNDFYTVLRGKENIPLKYSGILQKSLWIKISSSLKKKNIHKLPKNVCNLPSDN